MDKHSLYQLITVVSNASEARDTYTALHQSRVAHVARRIAQMLAFKPQDIELIRVASVVHDIGKIGVPSELLSKVGKLRPEEFDLIKIHPVVGYEILKSIDTDWPLATVVRQHHERIDGSGYPDGLMGSEILLESKIIAVADVIEAMTQARPYREALGLPAAYDEIKKNSGIAYDKEVACAALSLMDELGMKIFEE